MNGGMAKGLDQGVAPTAHDRAEDEKATRDQAERWAALLGTSIPDGATTVPLAVGELRFIDMTGGGRGLASVEFARSTADPDRTGRPDRNSEPDRTGRSTTICGVRLTITEQESR